eukprot:gene32058-39600_t
MPELVAAVKSGTISLNAAAAVATLPAEEQVAAAVAGKDELKQAAKRVREAKRKTREETPVKAADEAVGPTDAPAADELQTLRARVAELTAENEALRQQLAQLRGSDAPSSGDDGQPQLGQLQGTALNRAVEALRKASTSSARTVWIPMT